MKQQKIEIHHGNHHHMPFEYININLTTTHIHVYVFTSKILIMFTYEIMQTNNKKLNFLKTKKKKLC